MGSYRVIVSVAIDLRLVRHPSILLPVIILIISHWLFLAECLLLKASRIGRLVFAVSIHAHFLIINFKSLTICYPGDFPRIACAEMKFLPSFLSEAWKLSWPDFRKFLDRSPTKPLPLSLRSALLRPEVYFY